MCDPSACVVSQPRTRVAKVKILIIEDEAKTAAYIKQGLTENGFVVDVTADGDDGAHLATSGFTI